MIGLSPPCESGAVRVFKRKPAKPQERILYMRSCFGPFREGLCALRKRIVQEHSLRLSALGLSARGAGKRALRDDLDLPHGDADLFGDRLLDLFDELVRVARERFG